YDIRTPSEFLTDELAIRLARAEAWYFHECLGVRSVLVGHDARSMGPHYLNITAEIYRESGLDVTLIPGACSTSKFYFAAMDNSAKAGVLIGASHNPAGDTGRKIIGPGVCPIARDIGPMGGLRKIEDFYRNDLGVPQTTQGTLSLHDPTENYIDYSMSLAGVPPQGLEGFPVLHDYLNGAAGYEMMEAFETAAADLHPIHAIPDGGFPLGDPNPVKESVTREGRLQLETGKYRMGVFFDGDGDRIDFYSGEGRYLSSSFVYAAILPEILNRFEGENREVFACLKSNPLAVMEMAKAGVQVSVNRNGHSQIKQSMIDYPEILGGVEESAHYYERFRYDGQDYCTENTLYFVLLVTRLWRDRPEAFDRLFEIQSQTAREREWGHRFPSDESRVSALLAVEKEFTVDGASAMRKTSRGEDLEATLMRRGLPFNIDAATRLDPDWLQVCQRVSQSENGLARWEVATARKELAREAKERIQLIIQEFGAGEEYQG
ncbi:MAG: phosphoglucomutase, partial [Candidatus Omnitrophica bacterium]|nr:phosphoglucomutase [Candidatus Omnitrophota bacterium]